MQIKKSTDGFGYNNACSLLKIFAKAGSIAPEVARSSRRIDHFRCISRNNKIKELSNKAFKALLGLNSNSCPQFEAN